MAKSKDDPLLNRLFEDPAGGDKAAEGTEDAQARAALRRDVLDILDAPGDETTNEPLHDGLISAYLDDALEAPERTALEARLAASSVLREQVAAASLAREAGLQSDLAMPPAFAADFDAVSGPAKTSTAKTKEQPAGLIGRLFGAPMPARRWLAASLPVLAVVVVVAALGPQIVGEREALKSPGEGAGRVFSKPPADAEVKLRRAEEREADRRKRDASPPPAEAAKPKPKAAPNFAKRSGGRAGAADGKAKSTAGGKEIAVLTTTVVPLSSELRDAVVTLGRSQQGQSVALPSKKEMRKRSFALPRPSTGSSADKAARESRSDKPVAGILSQRPAGQTPGYIDVINRAVAPDCTKDPASCCGSHRVDDNLLNRLLTSEPLQSVKVLHLSSRACYLTLP